MNSQSNIQPDAPFNRSNYILHYTPEEQQYAKEFSANWMKTKGLLSCLIGGGVTMGLLTTGRLSPNYKGIKVAAGSFGGFWFSRSFAINKLKQELKEKFPEGYVAQMYYLKHNEKAFSDYISFVQQQKGVFTSPGGGTYVPPTQRQPPAYPQQYKAPQQPPPQQQPSQPLPPPPPQQSSDSPQTPKGLDDRFRPQMDGLNQGKSPHEDDEKMGKSVGSYAMWRQQSGPPRPGQGMNPSSYGPPPDTYTPPPAPSEFDRVQPPAPSQTLPRRPTSQDSQASRKPVRRNQYGDIIEDQ